MMRLEMLPAAHGDCLWLEYGDEQTSHRILIDGGPGSCYESLRWRILMLPPEQRRFELLIITHVDADHIEGIIKLLQDDELGVRFDDIWFNDFVQLSELPDAPDPLHDLGAVQGEFLGALIEQRTDQSWNGPFDKKAIVVPSGDAALPSTTLPSGLHLTVLSPTLETLVELRDDWQATVEAAGFTPGNREEALTQLKRHRRLGPPKQDQLGDESDRGSLDHSSNNGSSIAVLAEYGGTRLLLAGDAYATVLRESLQRWMASTGNSSVKLDGFKVPHHGSSKNMTPQLLEVLKCKHYLISTSGAMFGHPDQNAVDMLIEHHRARGRCRLVFNYASDTTRAWADTVDQKTRGYISYFPQGFGLNFYP